MNNIYNDLSRLICLALKNEAVVQSPFSIFLRKGTYDPRILKHIEVQFKNYESAIKHLQGINDSIMLWKYLQAGYNLVLEKFKKGIYRMQCSDKLYGLVSQTLYAWNIETFQLSKVTHKKGLYFYHTIGSPSGSAGASLLATIHYDGPWFYIEVSSNNKTIWTTGLQCYVQDMKIAPNGRQLCYCYGESVCICDIDKSSQGSYYTLPMALHLLGLCYSPDSRYIAMLCDSLGIHIWDIEQKAFLPGYEHGKQCKKDPNDFDRLVYSADGKYIYHNFAEDGDLVVGRLNIATGQTDTYNVEYCNELFCIHPDGKHIVVSDDGYCKWFIINIETKAVYEFESKGVESMCLSPNGELLFMVEEHKIVVRYFNKLIEGPSKPLTNHYERERSLY